MSDNSFLRLQARAERELPFSKNLQDLLHILRTPYRLLARQRYEFNFRDFASRLWMELRDHPYFGDDRLEWQNIKDSRIPTIASIERHKSTLVRIIEDHEDLFDEESVDEMLSLQHQSTFCSLPWVDLYERIKNREAYGISAIILHAVWTENHKRQMRENQAINNGRKQIDKHSIDYTRFKHSREKMIAQMEKRLNIIAQHIKEYMQEEENLLESIQEQREIIEKRRREMEYENQLVENKLRQDFGDLEL